MNELLQEIDLAYKGLQSLEIQPTETNVDILKYAYGAIKKAFKYILDHPEHGEEEKPNAGDAGVCGRDED